MATNPLGPGKANVTAYTQKPRRRYLKARADRLRWSVSQFAGAVIELWFEQGCPAVDKIELRLPKMPYSEDGYQEKDKDGESSAVA
jgi:hypothetical protein